jgi:hypothetical protein
MKKFKRSFSSPAGKLLAFIAFFSSQAVLAQNSVQTPSPSPLARHYTEGEKLIYHMKGNNDGWQYDVTASGVVKKDANGHFFEEYGWSEFKSNAPLSLTPASLSFRQNLSLDPNLAPGIPNLSQIQPMLIGPITDMLTFYSDLWLALRQDGLKHAGDHAYIKVGGPASWADGNYVVLGEDSIDFDLTLKAVDTASHVATLVARHVPPSQPTVKLPAEWMHQPVADTPNNWVDVKKNNGKYVAEVGKETFDVEIKVSLADGKILSATLDNPVEALKRECSDAVLSDCGAPVRHQIRRQIELQLVP